MKAFIVKSLSLTSMVVLSLALGSSAYAEKGAETLVRLTSGTTPVKAAVVATASHKCGTCSDSLVSRKDYAAKVANQTQVVVRHNCNSCDTKIVTKGEGKAKSQVAMHACGADVKAACCTVN